MKEISSLLTCATVLLTTSVINAHILYQTKLGEKIRTYCTRYFEQNGRTAI